MRTLREQTPIKPKQSGQRITYNDELYKALETKVQARRVPDLEEESSDGKLK